ncbi:MAG TPA: hypothetical protein VL128_13860 [Candidatus Eisenbacteria bacterium]|jgi:hypothetical protein|nr:hypothetical protein [Candidatus Eisenbacteria bacterium]
MSHSFAVREQSSRFHGLAKSSTPVIVQDPANSPRASAVGVQEANLADERRDKADGNRPGGGGATQNKPVHQSLAFSIFHFLFSFFRPAPRDANQEIHIIEILP